MIFKVNKILLANFWMDCWVANNMFAFIVMSVESKNSFWEECCTITLEIGFILTIVLGFRD